jgi:hypothetical protein
MSPHTSVVLYHRTSIDNARAILTDGFRDSAGFFLNTRTWTGVWFCSSPASSEQGEVVLTVKLDIDDEELARWEWTGEGRDYREWLIPANIANRRATIELTEQPNSIAAA